jgi:hypothetical protein
MTTKHLPLISDTPSVPSRSTPQLVPVTCRRCKRHLLDTLPGAGVLCPHCHVWTVAGQMPARAGNRSGRYAHTHLRSS